ncbi:MAG: SHOCT domain-containing protein [Desulfopila sp.]
MTEIIHTSRITITRDRGPIRIAQIIGFSEPISYGVHGRYAKGDISKDEYDQMKRDLGE